MRSLVELKELIDVTRGQFTKLTFEASIVTGFEGVASGEVLEKLGKNSKVCTSRGRVFFNTTFSKYHKYRCLRCVDRVNVLAGIAQVSFGSVPDDKKDDLKKIEKTVNVFDWEKVLAIWKEVYEFRGNVYPTREEYELAIALGKNTNDSTIKIPSPIKKDEVVFKCKDLYFEKTNLEKALDSVVSDSDEDETGNKCDTQPNTIHDDKRIPKFRVTCNRVGEKHSFTSVEAETVFGGFLQDKFNWIVDLSNYDLEIILEINREDIYAGIALNTRSNHYRNLTCFGPTTLRATICHNMLRLCNVQPGDVVIDPMCGVGSISIEGCLSFPKIFCLAGDEHEKAVAKARSNITSLSNLKVDSIRWDVTHLPLKTNSIDVFVTDLPFGKRCGSKSNNKNLYKCAFNEFARVLRLKTGRCVVLTADRTSLDLAFLLTKSFWKMTKFLVLNVGGLKAYCMVLQRTEEEYQLKLSRKERKLLAHKEWLLKKMSQNAEES